MINLFKRSKKNKLLLTKFNQLEQDIDGKSEEVENVRKESLQQNNQDLENEKLQTSAPSVYEEEVFWWESVDRKNEVSPHESSSGTPAAILYVFKKTELYNKISGLADLEMNYYDDGNKNVITVMWGNPYLNLADRRSYLKLIEDVCIDLAKNGIKCSLIHDNKRLAISNNIGVKLVSTQDHMTISEESTSKREVAI